MAHHCKNQQTFQSKNKPCQLIAEVWLSLSACRLLCDCVDQLPCIKRSTTSLHVTVRATWPSPRMMPTAIKPTVRERNKLLQHTRAFVNSLTVLNGSLKRQYHLYASGSTHTLPEKLGHITQVTLLRCQSTHSFLAIHMYTIVHCNCKSR